jgi:hypothetical protein
MVLAPVLTPHGTLALKPSNDGVALPRGLGAQLQAAFARGSGHGLLALGADHVGAALPPVLSYWRELGVRYVTALCALPGLGDGRAKSAVPLPADDTLQRMSAGVPPIAGAEYLTAAALADLWHRIDAAFEAEQAEAELPAQDFFKARHPAWNLVGRVHFNLAENRKDEAAPFAFMATYTTGLSVEGKAQHLPLGKALQDYAGARNRQRLLSLLTPVQRSRGVRVAEGHGRCGGDLPPPALEAVAGDAVPQGRAVVGKACAQSKSCQQVEPLHARLLIGPQRSLQRVSGVHASEPSRAAQSGQRLRKPGTGHRLAPLGGERFGNAIAIRAGTGQEPHGLAERQAFERQEHHRRPSRQDRGQGLLPPEPQAGCALR